MPPLPEEYSEDLRCVLASLLRVDPAARPTADQLLAHPAVAPRLALLRAQGLVEATASGPSAGPSHAEQVREGRRHSGSSSRLLAGSTRPRLQPGFDTPRPLPPLPQARDASLMRPCYSTCGGATADDSPSPPGLGPVASLAELLEQLPPPRYSRGLADEPAGAAEEQCSGDGQHGVDPLMSNWYRSTSGPLPAAAAAMAVDTRPCPAGTRPAGQPASPQQQQAAALQALQRPSPLAGGGKAGDGLPSPAVICIRADATAAAAAAPAAPSAEEEPPSPARRSRSLPEGPAAAPSAGVGAALHPKYAAMVAAARAAEAAGAVRPRPTSRSPSPAKAPASPMPVAARRQPLSTAGSGVSLGGGSSATPRRSTASSALDVRALDARILEAQRSGGAAALAAAVRSSLADHDALLLRHASARLSRLSARGAGATPRTPGTSRLALALVEASEDVAGKSRLGMTCQSIERGMNAEAAQTVDVPAHLPAPLRPSTAGSEPSDLGVHRSSPSCPNLSPPVADPAHPAGHPRLQEVPRQQTPPKRRWTLVGMLRRRGSQAG